MAEFMLLLRESTTDFAGLSAAEIEAIIGEYKAWSAAVAGEGKLIGGQKLKDESGKHLKMDNGSLRITDGPYAETKELIGGYFAIIADSYDDAVKTAQSCPHLKFGGSIELREVEPTN